MTDDERIAERLQRLHCAQTTFEDLVRVLVEAEHERDELAEKLRATEAELADATAYHADYSLQVARHRLDEAVARGVELWEWASRKTAMLEAG